MRKSCLLPSRELLWGAQVPNIQIYSADRAFRNDQLAPNAHLAANSFWDEFESWDKSNGDSSLMPPNALALAVQAACRRIDSLAIGKV
jgi:hypothetical protein